MGCCGGSIVKTCETQFIKTFAMMENMIEQCPEEIWSVKAGGFVFWQQIIHALSGANYWMRQPESAFTEPFADRKVYPELDNEPIGRVSREEMTEYKNYVKALCRDFFEGKDDSWLMEPSSILDKISNMDVLLMQIRHIQYHVGHCNSILRDRGYRAVDWIEYCGES